MSDTLIERAIHIFHKEKPRSPQPGDVIAHLSDEYTYTVRSVDQEKITGFCVDENGQELVKEFPPHEVFNPGVVLTIVQRLRSQMN